MQSSFSRLHLEILILQSTCTLFCKPMYFVIIAGGNGNSMQCLTRLFQVVKTIQTLTGCSGQLGYTCSPYLAIVFLSLPGSWIHPYLAKESISTLRSISSLPCSQYNQYLAADSIFTLQSLPSIPDIWIHLYIAVSTIHTWKLNPSLPCSQNHQYCTRQLNLSLPCSHYHSYLASEFTSPLQSIPSTTESTSTLQ